MKKITYLLIAAFVTLSVASCVKDQFEKVGPENPYGAEITVSLNPVTRTALEEGKTVWMEGDLLWVSNGAGVDTVAVPESAVGQQSFSFKTVNATPTEANPDVFIVYPVTAASKVADGKVVVKVPGVQLGTFEAANICAGQSKEGVVSLRNVTGVLKVNVPAEPAAPVYQLVFSAVGETPLSGECTVDLSGNDPVVTSAKTSSSVTVQAGGFDGDFFAAVIPGTYEAGFKMTAATVDFEHASETKVSTVENTVGINEIVDLGTIGTDLKPLDGDGSDANPYLIENLGHLIALATAVDNGEESQTFEGQYFKVMEDVSGVSIPIGSSSHPFCGSFDGNGKTITLSMSGAQANQGLFAALSYGANVTDLVIDGRISSSASNAGGVVGYIVTPKDSLRPQITNVTNKAVITGVSNVGGIAGRTSFAEINSCKNEAALEAETNAGGIIGFSYQTKVNSCVNWGTITGTKDCGKVMLRQDGNHRLSYLDGSGSQAFSSDNNTPTLGVGGIAGWAQVTTFDECVNNGKVSAVSKAGGIAGAMFMSSHALNCSNAGEVVASADLAGGIVGWFFKNGSLKDNKNSGPIQGRAAIGGIAGMTNGGIANANIIVSGCSNKGAVTSTYETATGVKVYNYTHGNASCAGGIVGLSAEYFNGSSRSVTQFSDCVNDGTVTGKGQAVGGICGMRAAVQNSTRTGFIDKCVNNGTVESLLYRAGGIIGVCFDRFTSSLFEIRNCANHGTVKAPYVVAGIAAWISTAYPASPTGYYECINNCYNDGPVLYNKSAYDDGKGPYAGGILGYSQQTSVYNVVNYGDVKPIEGEPNEYDVKLYAVDLAFLGKTGRADYLYGPDGELALIGPTAGDPPAIVGANMAKILEDGSFDKAVVINNVECQFPVDALNQWIAGVTETPELYLEWKDGAKGPVFVE